MPEGEKERPPRPRLTRTRCTRTTCTSCSPPCRRARRRTRGRCRVNVSPESYARSRARIWDCDWRRVPAATELDGGGCVTGADPAARPRVLAQRSCSMRQPDRIRHRQHLVRPETDRAIGRDAAQLPVHFHQRNARAQRERDQPAHRLRVRHRRAAGLAERDEHLERLPPIVLGDGARTSSPSGVSLRIDVAAQLVRARPLLRDAAASPPPPRTAAFLQPLDLRVQLGDASRAARRPRDARLRRRRRVALGLRLARRRAGRQHLRVARAVAIHRDALALQVVRQLVDRAHVLDGRGVREVASSC